MGLVLKYVVKTKAGAWQYRRRVPAEVGSAISKREFKQWLGETERAALATWPRYHAQVEREIADARRALARGAALGGVTTDREAYNAATSRVAELLSAGTPEHLLDVLADSMLERHRADRETGGPSGVSRVDTHTINLLRNGDAYAAPPVTLEDARRHYVSEHMSGPEHEKDKRAVNRVGRVIEMAIEALGRDPVLISLSRDDARKVRDHMLGRIKSTGEKISPTSVARELNTVKAVVSYAKVEMGLPGDFQNPFNGLPMGGSIMSAPDADKRDPLPPKVLKSVRERVLSSAGAELGLMWRLLEGTGGRLAEVSGLRLEDIVVSGPLGGEFPHIRVTWHEDRRLKTKASVRHVPLVGDALGAAKEALKLPREGHMLFSTYGRHRGSDAASAALMKHIRRISDNPKHVVHSLRHNMKDSLNLAEVGSLDQNLILGHALGGVGDRVYGGGLAKLRQTTRALRRAMGLSDLEIAADGADGGED